MNFIIRYHVILIISRERKSGTIDVDGKMEEDVDFEADPPW